MFNKLKLYNKTVNFKILLKWYRNPEKVCSFIFSTSHFKKYDSKKKSGLDQNLCQVVFFRCDAIFDKLRANFLWNPLLHSTKGSLYLGKKDYSLKLKF